MEPPFQAYRGNELYIFVSYAHADKAIVYPEIQLLHDRGCRIWFDEGITPAREWSEEIAQAINECSFFVVFMTSRAAESGYVRREIHFAVDKKKPFLTIYREPTTLSDGLQWLIGPVQAIAKHEIQHVMYLEKLGQALPKATISSPRFSPAGQMQQEEPAEPYSAIREKAAGTEPVNDSAPQGPGGSPPTISRSELHEIFRMLARKEKALLDRVKDFSPASAVSDGCCSGAAEKTGRSAGWKACPTVVTAARRCGEEFMDWKLS